jgi:hypothetical protein
MRILILVSITSITSNLELHFEDKIKLDILRLRYLSIRIRKGTINFIEYYFVMKHALSRLFSCPYEVCCWRSLRYILKPAISAQMFYLIRR